ncbi:MAG: RHS repeat-associated core domain-containing protein, partial [Gammaproteobacteria bacterium]
TAGALDDTDWYSYDAYGNVFNHAQKTFSINANSTVVRTAQYRNYNTAGLPQYVVNFDASIDQITYDTGYKPLQTIHTVGTASQTTSNTYDFNEQLSSSTDADGKVTNYGYDSLERLSIKTFPNGNTETYIYHPNNVLYEKAQNLPNGTNVTSYFQDVDANGHIDYTRPGGENTLYTSFIRDNNGNVVETVTAAGIVNLWSYDALNRVTSHTDGNGYVDNKSYDNASNNTNETAANGAGSSRGFINENVLGSEQNSDFGAKNYGYDLDNNLHLTSFMDRQCTYGTSDQLSRPQGRNCSSTNNSDPTMMVNDNFFYDQSAFGNLDQVTANNSGRGVDTSYGYDAFHRVISKTQTNHTPHTLGYPQSTQTVGYSYTSAGHLTNITYPSGNKVSYSYDGSGMLSGIQLNNNSLVSSIAYYGSNRLRSFNWGTTSASFNLAINDQNLITGVQNVDTTGASNFNVNYGYDLDGRIISINQILGGTTTNYTYDNNSQLLSENAPSLSEYIGYSYDNNGNRLTLQSTGVAGNSSFGAATGSSATCAFNSSAYADYYPDLKAAFGYNAAQLQNHWLVNGMSEGRTPCGAIYPSCKFNSSTYVSLWPDLVAAGVNGTSHYKTNGINEGRGICPASSNTVAVSDYRFGYSGNRLSSWQKNGNYQTVNYTTQGELTGTYVGISSYDAAGRRRAESGVPGSSQYTAAYFDYNHKNERTYKGGNLSYSQYVYDENSHLIGEYDVAGNMVVEYIWLDDRPVAAIYPGNVVVYIVTDHQNKPRRGINATTQQVVWKWDPDAFGVIQPNGSVTINLRFPGQYYDVQSGLYYNHNRYYNPELGRYMEPDPLGMKPGLNPYAYAGNDPVNKTDPTGLDSVGQNIDAGAMRAAANGNNLGVAAWAAASAVWTLGGAESISLGMAGEPTSMLGVGLEALGAIPGVGEAKGAIKAGETFFHYTDEAGAKAIKESGILQSNSRGQVFLTKDKLSPSEVKDRLFLGRSGDKGSHVVEVNMREGAAIEPGKNTNEFIHQGAIRDGRQGDIQRISQNGF